MCIRDRLTKLGSELFSEENFSIEKLSEKIRNKELDYENQSLIDFLYDLTEEKVKIDNPKYK